MLSRCGFPRLPAGEFRLIPDQPSSGGGISRKNIPFVEMIRSWRKAFIPKDKVHQGADHVFEWIQSIILGAVAGAVASELRDRYKENRKTRHQRKILAFAFQAKIQGDLDVLECRSLLTKYLSADETAYYLSTSPLWELKQTEVFQYAPDLASALSDYFVKLTILVSKMSYKPDTRFPISTYNTDDTQVVIDAGKEALLAIEQYIE